MKKSLILIIPLLILFSLVLVSAINLKIDKQIVSDVVISQLSEPAVFDFSITNLGEGDSFEIYSLVGVDISPRGFFSMASGETKNIQVQFFPNDKLKSRPGITTFSYKLRGQNSGIQEDTITINIADLKDAIGISVENINPESSEATINIENKVNFNFNNLRIKFDSAFFSAEKNVSIGNLESEKIIVPLDREKMKKLVAGQYILSSKIISGDTKETIESTIKFVEQSGVSTKETVSGILLRERIIEKTNEGNIPTVAEITLKKDIVSRLFTTFSSNPDKAERKGFVVSYSWVKEIKPSEVLSVRANTNYLYPLIIVLAILLGIVLIRIYTASDLIIDKRVSYVKTKGGEFALKVSVIVKARKFVQKIALVDRLPPIVKLFEKYGSSMPTRYDERTRRLEWDIDSLDSGEERIFSYIVYSKMGFVGKFELPAATAIYEKDGKIKESASNRAFFMNEPRKREE